MKIQLFFAALLSFFFSGLASAEVPAAVTSAISQAGTDMATVAGAVFVAIIALLGFKLMRRAAH